MNDFFLKSKCTGEQALTTKMVEYGMEQKYILTIYS